ncbi:RNA-guided endonuclease InsQ/TnpB family protein [Effusibacillus lacus]|nr:transposase [Effusibacillus lacus]
MKLSKSTLKHKVNESDFRMDSVLHFEIRPTAEQEKQLFHTFDLCRKLYNYALDQRIRSYKETGKGLTYRDQQNMLPAFKEANPEYKAVQSQVLQDVLRRLDRAFVNFFEKRAGYPRFKDKLRFRSITIPQSDVRRNFGKEGYIYIPKIGHIKLNAHQAFDPSKVKIINVKFQNGKWYTNLTVETDSKPPVSDIQLAVGIDMGLFQIAVTSDGEQYENPRWITKSEKRLKKLQRRLSQKHKGSQNRQKAKHQLQKLHDHISNQRKDYLHKISHRLVQKYVLICIEDLQVKGMMKNHRLAKSIANASWNRLANYLEYKSRRFGKTLVKVNPKNTSQKCSNCRQIVKKNLSERIHQCPYCHVVLDRDLNAAINILQAGLNMIA